LVQTHFGRVSVAIRENELRAELIGYDIRFYKLALFTVGGAVAGVGGVIFCNGVGRVSPDVFSLHDAALTIIWVIVGGRGTLIGPVLGAFGLFYLTSFLGTQGVVNNNLVLGIILILFVLLVPRGIVPTLVRWWDRARARRMSQRRELRLRRRRGAGGVASEAAPGGGP
jgi:branched-chain amino acid transport system permease protein